MSDQPEDCVWCNHPFSTHTEGDFQGCSESDCSCCCYWDSEDEALANAD